METRRLPPKLLDDFARAREANESTFSGPNTRIELDDAMDESDELVGLLPFGRRLEPRTWFEMLG